MDPSDKLLKDSCSWSAGLSLEKESYHFGIHWYLTWIGNWKAEKSGFWWSWSLKLTARDGGIKGCYCGKAQAFKFIDTLLRLSWSEWTESMELNRLAIRTTVSRTSSIRSVKKRKKWPIQKAGGGIWAEIFSDWSLVGSLVLRAFSRVFTNDQSFDFGDFWRGFTMSRERACLRCLRGRQGSVVAGIPRIATSDLSGENRGIEEEGINRVWSRIALWIYPVNFFEKKHPFWTLPISWSRFKFIFPIEFLRRKNLRFAWLATVLAENLPFRLEKIEGLGKIKMNNPKQDVGSRESKRNSIGIPRRRDRDCGLGITFSMELIREGFGKRLRNSGYQTIKVQKYGKCARGTKLTGWVIVFGYAPKRLKERLHPLRLWVWRGGKSGSENRLKCNHASRKRMHVNSSIAPEDFALGQLKNPGSSVLTGSFF